ncbi:MAG: hypothetical protein HN509_15470 [Halobacteriovoraceae bacterium]|nr:hypothetical protein [Halobacteriovoraceae bacterium]MBT5092977.1 hypothetical protein [Halobacteriovoraceae bacterium]
MKKILKIVCYLLALVPLVALPIKLAFYNESPGNQQPELKAKMLARFKLDVRYEMPKPYSLNKLTTFKWQKLYVFGPYNKSKDVIEKRLGFAWEKSASFSGILGGEQDGDDSNCLLVFVDGNDVVQYDIFSRGDMDFSMILRDGHYTPSEAIITRVGKNSKGVIFP